MERSRVKIPLSKKQSEQKSDFLRLNWHMVIAEYLLSVLWMVCNWPIEALCGLGSCSHYEINVSWNSTRSCFVRLTLIHLSLFFFVNKKTNHVQLLTAIIALKTVLNEEIYIAGPWYVKRITKISFTGKETSKNVSDTSIKVILSSSSRQVHTLCSGCSNVFLWLVTRVK